MVLWYNKLAYADKKQKQENSFNEYQQWYTKGFL